MSKNIIITFTIVLVFISVSFIFNSNEPVTNKITNSNIENNTSKEDAEKLIQLTSIYNNNLQKKSENHYVYILPTNNILDINLIDKNISDIKYVEFDSNKLDIQLNSQENILNLRSKYELVPGKNVLKIVYKSVKEIKKIDLDISYLYDASSNINSNIEKNWIMPNSKKCKAYLISERGITLGGQCNKTHIVMEYEKNFDRDVTLTCDFTYTDFDTVDLQFTFGERMYANFNNSKIDIKRKEYDQITNKEKIHLVKSQEYKRFKKNNPYQIIYSRINDTYTVKVIDLLTNDISNEIEYIDDGANVRSFQRYKNLRISVGRNNMKLLISRIEIK